MGARRWLRLTKEATYGTYDSGGTTAWIRLDTDNAFTPQIMVGRNPIRDAGGGNRRVQVVSSTHTVTGKLSTLLYPAQASAILAWATTLTSNELSSYTADFYDSVRPPIPWRQGRFARPLMRCPQGEGVLRAELKGSRSKPTRERPVALEPAYSSFPTTTPYVFKQSSTGFTVGGSVRTKYNKFSCSIKESAV